MKIFPRISAIATRDPVGQRIELCLHKLQAQGQGIFKIEEEKKGVRVSFGGSIAKGLNLDIALVRLAAAMLDDARFAATLMSCLAIEMRAGEHRHAGGSS